MESENAANLSIEVIANEEKPTSVSEVETFLPEVSTVTTENATENTIEAVPSRKTVKLSIFDPKIIPFIKESHEEINSIDIVPSHISRETSKISLDILEDDTQSVDTVLDAELAAIIEKEAEHRETLTIENLQIIEQEKKQMKMRAKLLAREEKSQKAKADKPFKKQTIRIGNFETELSSGSEEEESPSTSDEDERSQISLKSFKFDFLSKLGSLPRISNISLDREEPSLVATIPKIVKPEVDPDLKGKFVDLLTGEPLTESESTEQIEEESIAFDELDVESISSELELPMDEDDLDLYTAKPDEVNFFFDDADESMAGRTEFIFESASVLFHRQVKYQAEEITKRFLNELFDKIVTIAETPVVTLPEKLDKIKLFTELNDAVTDHKVEQYTNSFLNIKAVDCCRRLRRRYTFARLSDTEEKFEYRRYKYALDNLDRLKEEAAVAKKKASTMTTTVLLELEEVDNVCNSLNDRIAQLIRDTLIRKDSELLSKAIEIDLQRMRYLQNEISESRTTLINRKHTLAKLIERTFNFEKITGDLTTNEFLAVQRDVINLGKRLNERDERLRLIHDRCNKELKRAVYYHERRNFDMTNLGFKKEILDQLCTKRDDLRKKLCQLKLEHIRNMTQKQDLSIKAGLLYKPALMIDYDRTVELVAERRKKVLEMRNTLDNLEKRFNVINSRPKSLDSRKTIRKLWAI